MCGVCLTSSVANEEGIAASDAPPPTEPETRLARLAAALEDPRNPPPAALVPALRLEVERLRAIIDTAITPTKYVPDAKLKGGKGR